MSNPPNPTNNDLNGSRDGHGPLRHAEQYTAESIVSVHPGQSIQQFGDKPKIK